MVTKLKSWLLTCRTINLPKTYKTLKSVISIDGACAIYIGYHVNGLTCFADKGQSGLVAKWDELRSEDELKVLIFNFTKISPHGRFDAFWRIRSFFNSDNVENFFRELRKLSSKLFFLLQPGLDSDLIEIPLDNFGSKNSQIFTGVNHSKY